MDFQSVDVHSDNLFIRAESRDSSLITLSGLKKASHVKLTNMNNCEPQSHETLLFVSVLEISTSLSVFAKNQLELTIT